MSSVGPVRTLRDLRLLGRALKPPFRLLLKWQERPMMFDVDLVLRHIPGHRLVCRGELEGRAMVMKLFLHPTRQKQDSQREFDGFRALVSAGVPVVSLQGRGELVESKDPLVLYDYVHAAEPLTKQWWSCDERGQQAIFRTLVELLVQLHRGNVLLGELHLDNFLIVNKRLVCVDSGGAERKEQPLDVMNCLSDLALLQAQVPAHWDERLSSTLDIYGETRGWSIARAGDGAAMTDLPTLPPVETFAQLVQLRRNARCEAFARQAFRNDGGVITERVGNYQILCMRDEFETLQPHLQDPEQLLYEAKLSDAGPAGSIYHWQKFIIKRYNAPTDWRGRMRHLRRAAAERAWANAQRLRALNISTARPIACVVERGLGQMPRRSWVVTEVPALPSLAQRLERGEDPTDRELRALWQMFRCLVRARISHGDLKASNVLCGESEQGLDVGLIDLDRMRVHNSDAEFVPAWQADMARFSQNFQRDARLAQRFALTIPVLDEAD